MRKIFRHHETVRLFGGVAGTLAVFALSAALAAEQPSAPAAAPPAPGAQPPAPGVTPAPDQAAKARAAAVAAKANIDVYEAWTRATPNDATTAAIYLKISSNKDADKVIGAETGASNSAEFREEAAGKASTLASVDIPAGATVDFKPGGRQVVLTGLKAPLKEGDAFILTLRFDKAGAESTAVRVLGANATAIPAASSTRKGDTTAAVSPLPKP